MVNRFVILASPHNVFLPILNLTLLFHHLHLSASILKIQNYKKDFNVNNTRLSLSNNQLQSIDLTGLVNLQYLDLMYNLIVDVDLIGLINLKYSSTWSN